MIRADEIRRDGAVYKRRPGETERDLMLRRSADYRASCEALAARTASFIGPRRPLPITNRGFPVGVGTFDANGAGKGAGW